eukprot:sb/3477775/
MLRGHGYPEPYKFWGGPCTICPRFVQGYVQGYELSSLREMSFGSDEGKLAFCEHTNKLLSLSRLDLIGFFEVVTPPFCRTAPYLRVTAPTCSHFSVKTRISPERA